MHIDSDDFALFGLPRRFSLDRHELDARRRSLQAEVHPDRFAAAGGSSQRVAMQWAVRVNEAYERLGNPLRRAAYLCELAGTAIDGESHSAMPVEFLSRHMAWREALDEAQSLERIEALAAELEAERRAGFHLLERTLDDENDVEAAAARIRELMFVERFAADVDERLAAVER